METSGEPKRCFVVMGFGMKTDYATGRELDLDKSYRLLIKPVVEAKGLVCIRADEIRHSGTIDVPMYQELLTADVVIADLSTANPNAIYELGIRHALRPWTTVVISEKELRYPFDLNHVMITGYTHLGKYIDYEEVLRFQDVLGKMLDAVLQDQKPDSPVYTFLNNLTPPSLGQQAAQAVAQAGQALGQAGDAIAEAASRNRTPEPGPKDPTLAVLIAQGEQAVQKDDFAQAKAMFSAALKLCERKPDDATPPAPDPYLIHRLVLATYKSRQPDPVSALNEALGLLDVLNLKDSNDPETVGLAGAIEKRLFDNGQGAEHLERSIGYYGRGYYLRNDYYNGINLAYLLNLRADSALDQTEQDRIADLVWANRIRREVLEICRQELEEIGKRGEQSAAGTDTLRQEQEVQNREQKFWCLATMAEAYFGMGEQEGYNEARSQAEALSPAGWMIETMDSQMNKLRDLLQKHGHLLNPPWPGIA